jgi:hypothetical protein
MASSALVLAPDLTAGRPGPIGWRLSGTSNWYACASLSGHKRSNRYSNCRVRGPISFGSPTPSPSRQQREQEKSRLTTVEEGFAFLGFEFRKAPKRLLYMWPRKKACQHIRDRVREVVRSFRSSASIGEVIRKLNPILMGCVPISGLATATGSFTRSIGPCRASCSYGSDANTNAVGVPLGSAGTISSCINGAGCTKW